MRYLLLGLLLTVSAPAILAQSNPFQGIYAGMLPIGLSSRGFKLSDYPARMTVLPDGHSIILTAQLPGNLSNQVIEGTFKGDVFEGISRGRVNVLLYNWANYWQIRFLRNEARIFKDVVLHPAAGFVQVRKILIFRKIAFDKAYSEESKEQ